MPSTFTPPILVAYWLPSVGIGAAVPPPPVLNGNQTVVVPVTDLLNYVMPNGQPQVNVVHLTGASFVDQSVFGNPAFLQFNDGLQEVLTNGSVRQLQNAGIQVVLTIMGSGGNSMGWSAIPEAQIPIFTSYLVNDILGTYGLNGIDIDDEYGITGDTLTQTVQMMGQAFPPGMIISKALWDDLGQIPSLAPYLTYGGIMYYGDDASGLEETFNEYVNAGMTNGKLLIGVNAGPVAQGGSFTSVETTVALTKWQPQGDPKLGMMIWTFSQDIQQFTAAPQNQVALAYPNPGDHQWQTAIIGAS